MKPGDWVRHKKTKQEGAVLRTDGESVIVNFTAENWPFPVMTKLLVSNVYVIKKQEPEQPEGEPAPF